MGKVHRLPGMADDDRRQIMIVTTRADLRVVLTELHSTPPAEAERPLSVKEFATLYGVDSKRVYEWIEAGLPRVRTGDRRGSRIWPDKARTWLEENHG